MQDYIGVEISPDEDWKYKTREYPDSRGASTKSDWQQNSKSLREV
jgi:hypothetical protein